MKKVFYIKVHEIDSLQPAVCGLLGSIAGEPEYDDNNINLGTLTMRSLSNICEAFKDDIIVILMPFTQDSFDIFLNTYWETNFHYLLTHYIGKYKNTFVYVGNDWDDIAYEFNGQTIVDFIINCVQRANVCLSKLLWSMNNPFMMELVDKKLLENAIDVKPFIYFNNYYFQRFKKLDSKYKVRLENHKDKNKHFLMANRRPADHRLALAAYIFTYYNEKTYLSFNNAAANPAELQCQSILPVNDYYTKCSSIFRGFENLVSKKHLQNFMDQWPIRLDYTGFGNFPIELQDSLETKFIYGSACNIIGETHYDSIVSHRSQGVFYSTATKGFFTEKSLKCFLWGLPSIWLSVPYTLKSLKDIGFKTFDGLIDERYDNFEDKNERFAAVVYELEKISRIKDINGWYNEGKSIYEYNFDLINQYIDRNNLEVIRNYCENQIAIRENFD